MACIVRTFFGLPLVEQTPPDLADFWAGSRDKPGILVFADRRLLWRLARSRVVKAGLSGKTAAIVPTGRPARRHVRISTGCDPGEHSGFQGPIRMLARAEEDGASVFIVDTTPAGVRRIEENIRFTFPGLRIVGRAVFAPDLVSSITTAIRKSDPRIVLVGTARMPVFRWVFSQLESVGSAVVVLAEEAGARMAGRSRGIKPGAVLFLPFRFLELPLLLGHRLVLRRRRKKSIS